MSPLVAPDITGTEITNTKHIFEMAAILARFVFLRCDTSRKCTNGSFLSTCEYNLLSIVYEQSLRKGHGGGEGNDLIACLRNGPIDD